MGRGGRGEIGEINGKETGVTIAQSLVRWRCSEVPISGHSGVPFFNFFFLEMCLIVDGEIFF